MGSLNGEGAIMMTELSSQVTPEIADAIVGQSSDAGPAPPMPLSKTDSAADATCVPWGFRRKPPSMIMKLTSLPGAGTRPASCTIRAGSRWHKMTRAERARGEAQQRTTTVPVERRPKSEANASPARSSG